MKIFFGWNEGETPQEMYLKKDVDRVVAGLVESAELCLKFADDEAMRRRMAQEEIKWLKKMILKLAPDDDLDAGGGTG